MSSTSTVMMLSLSAAARDVAAWLSSDHCHEQSTSAGGLSAQIGARAKALTANADDSLHAVFN